MALNTFDLTLDILWLYPLSVAFPKGFSKWFQITNMGTQYDENLNENEFFKQLKGNFEDILRTASENNWVICVPRKGCFLELELTKVDVLEHILIRNAEDYHNLNGKKIKKDGNNLVYESNGAAKRVHILFYEDFVIKKSKYSVWCIDEFLFNTNLKRIEIIQISNFCDCINLLWTDNLGCFVLDEINSQVQSFLRQFSFDDELDLKKLQGIIKDLYNSCLEIALTSFQNKTEENFRNNLKLAVESFMQACLKEKLFNFVCTHTAASDANVNKIIRNSQDISLKSLGIEKYFEVIPIARLELNKINNGNIILNKIICLKTVLNILKGVDTEMLLKILIFLIVKSNVCNWIANLTFITNFYFSKSDNFCTENDFITTTLNAALKYVSENNLSSLKIIEEAQNSFCNITRFIREGNLTMLMRNLCYQNKLTEKLCHPLCSCDTCEKLLQTNCCEINSRDEKGSTFLHHAAKSEHPDIVHFLIVEGSDINSTDYSGATPLHYAVSSGNQHGTFLLLHAGCDSNFKDFDGNTPLHIAVKNGHENCVEALLFFTNNNGENVDVNSANNNGDTPLHLAAKYGYLNLVKLLIEFGAKIIANRRGLTPLSIAHNDFVKDVLVNSVISDYIVIQKNDLLANSDFLTNYDEISSISKTEQKVRIPEEKKFNINFGQPPKNLNQIKKTDLLLKAIESNDTPLTCFYLGIPMPNSTNQIKTDCHPLCVCEKCSASKAEVVPIQTYKKSILNINVCNPDGFTPLHFAAKYGRLEILRLLLDAGALINLKSYRNFYTPLHLACINKKKIVVKELLKCGDCLVDVVDSFGNTPLHYTVINNDLEVFEMLLNEGSDITVKNSEGKNVRNIADDNTYLSILKILKERDKRFQAVDFVL